MCKNGEFDLEVKTTATPEIMTAMFDDDGSRHHQSSNRHLYFLVVVYVNGKDEVVSDSFELKISNTKASVYFSDSPNLLVVYIIDCVSVEADFMAYPTNRGYYGPQLDYIQRGFHSPEAIQRFHSFWSVPSPSNMIVVISGVAVVFTSNSNSPFLHM
jgi:hypothetical protein